MVSRFWTPTTALRTLAKIAPIVGANRSAEVGIRHPFRKWSEESATMTPPNCTNNNNSNSNKSNNNHNIDSNSKSHEMIKIVRIEIIRIMRYCV